LSAPAPFKRAFSHKQLILLFFFWIGIIFGNDDDYFWETMAIISAT